MDSVLPRTTFVLIPRPLLLVLALPRLQRRPAEIGPWGSPVPAFCKRPARSPGGIDSTVRLRRKDNLPTFAVCEYGAELSHSLGLVC